MDPCVRMLLLRQPKVYTDWDASMAKRLAPGGDEGGSAIAEEPNRDHTYGLPTR